MLILSRKVGEEVIINGDIRVFVIQVHGKRVRIGIQAPADVRIRRHDSPEAAKAPGAEPQPPLCSSTGCPG